MVTGGVNFDGDLPLPTEIYRDGNWIILPEADLNIWYFKVGRIDNTIYSIGKNNNLFLLL